MKKSLKESLEAQGFATKLFPESLQKIMLSHIDAYIREVGAPFIEEREPSLEKIAASIPDSIWAQKLTRAFRIFPSEISQKIHTWAHDSLSKELGRKRSFINVVYRQEVETNPKLNENSSAIYWRCVRPGKPDAGRPHRDASFWDLEFKEGYDPKIPFSFDYLKDCIKIWIPLKGCIPTTTLQIVPYSHNKEIPSIVEETEYGRRPTISSDWLKENEKNFISPNELSQGSCILFDMNLVHRGPTHHNTELRISEVLNFILQ